MYTTIDTTVGIYYSFQMTVCCPDWASNPTRTTDSHLKRTMNTNYCIHTVVHPDDGPRYARNMQRLTKCTKNKLCIELVFLYMIISICTVNRTKKTDDTSISCALTRVKLPQLLLHCLSLPLDRIGPLQSCGPELHLFVISNWSSMSASFECTGAKFSAPL